MSVTRYSRALQLDDLNNVHTFAVRAVPAGSRVLDLGAADGSVARGLVAKGCDVTAVERDPEGLESLAAGGIHCVAADLDALGEDTLPKGPFDIVLLLDVLEHLADPVATLTRAVGCLAPGGRVLVSVPHVAHAAVRLALLQGRFPRTDIGLLDRTHRHFFDRAQVDELMASAGLAVVDRLTVEREIQDTELALDAEAAPPELLAAIAADPSSKIYQFFIVAVAAPRSGTAGEGLLQAWQARFRDLEASYRALETYATSLDAEVLRLRERLEQVEGAVAASAVIDDDRVEASAARIRGAVAQELADLDADRAMLRQQLADRMAELQQSRGTIDVLLRDVEVQREFAATLAAQLPRVAARGGEAHVMRVLGQYEAIAATPEAAAALAAQAAELQRLQGTVALRALTRLDALSRRLPRLRAAMSALARRLAGTQR